MTTGPFPIPPDADPSDGTAAIAPVTAEMMDHAAHEAAAMADGVAHKAAETVPETDHAAPDLEPVSVVGMPEAEAAAAIAEIAPAAHETTAAAGDSLGLLNAKVMEIAAANFSAAGDFVSALLGATSAPEITAINADHLRRRFDALTTQGRDVMLLAQKVALEAMRLPGDGPHRT